MAPQVPKVTILLEGKGFGSATKDIFSRRIVFKLPHRVMLCFPVISQG